MSDFKAKMHQIRFRLGLRPRPAGGAYSLVFFTFIRFYVYSTNQSKKLASLKHDVRAINQT